MTEGDASSSPTNAKSARSEPTVRDIRAETAGIAASLIKGGVRQKNYTGPVFKRIDGDLVYQIVIGDEQVTVDATVVEAEYLDRVAHSELATIETMLGRVPIERLTVPTYLVPMNAGHDAPETSTAPISRDAAVRAIEALDIASRLVIVAGPGMGKTTFLNTLASAMTTHRTGGIPVPVSLYRYATEADGQTLIDFALETRFGEMYKGKKLAAFGDVFREWNREGKLLFLLDGLDEVPEERRRSLVDQLAALTRFVLTTRPIGRVDAYQPPGGTLQLLPLDDREVARFVFQWAALDGVGPTFEPRVVIRTVRHDPRLADLARVPQLLGLICYLWSRGTIRGFRTRADLFAQTTDAMISKGLDQLEVIGEERETLPRALRRWLRKLALDMLAHPTGARLRVTRDALLDDLEHGRSETEAARLFRLARASGIIVRTIDGVEQFQFVHLVFQEYLAAEALAASDDPIAMTARLQHRAAFEEPLRMACAIWADRGEDARLRDVLHGLTAPEQADLFGTNVLLAGQCLAEIEHVEQRLPEVVDTVAEQLMLFAGRWWLRARFAPVMAQLPTETMKGRLVAALSSDRMHDRWAAAVALGLMGDPATLEALRRQLDVEPNGAVSTALIDAIAGVGSPDAIPDLIAVLEWLSQQPRPDVFMAAAVGAALARLGAYDELAMLVDHVDIEIVGDAIVEALRYLPRKHAAPLAEALNAAGMTVRYATADEIEPGPSLDEVERLAESDDPATRIAAVPELGRIGNFDARWELLELLVDEDDDVSKAAAAELKDAWSDSWGLVASIDEVIGLLASEPDAGAAAIVLSLWHLPDVRDDLTRAWDETGSGGDSRASAVATLLGHEDEDIRAAVACLLGLVRARETLDQLGALLQADPSPNVREKAIWALGRFADAAALPYLLDVRDGASEDELSEACAALGATRSGEATPRLLQLLEHGATSVRRAAARALGSAGDDRAVDGLAKALDDPDPEVAVGALRTLGAFELPDASAVMALLRSGDAVTRAAAATGLRSTRADEVDAALGQSAQNDEDLNVVFAAIGSLGQAGRGDGAGMQLIGLLSSDVDEIRSEACYAISRLSYRPAMALLENIATSDSSDDVRRVAGQTYGQLADVQDIAEMIGNLPSPDDFDRLGAVAGFVSDHPDADITEISRHLANREVRLLARSDHRAVIVKSPNGDTKVRIGQPADEVPEGADPVAFYVAQLAAGSTNERWDAADALGRMKPVGAINALVQALLDADDVVAYEAARSIEIMTADDELHDAAMMALAAATADARRQGTLGSLIRLLIDERSGQVTQVVRELLAVPEAMCELLEDDSGDEDVHAALWTIAERYNLRFMPDDTVIMPSGERLACAVARSRLGVA